MGVLSVAEWALARAPALPAAARAAPADFYGGLVADAAAELGGATGRAIGNLAGTIGAAAVFAGPAAPFIAGAAGLLSVFGGLFGGGSPPAPPRAKIGGEDADAVLANPFKDFSRAVAVGRIVSGHGDAPQSFAGKAESSLREAVHAYRRGGSMAEGTKNLRAKFGPEAGYSVHAAAFFAAACDYDDLFPMLPDPGFTEELGKMLSWAAPRLRVSTVLTCIQYALTAQKIDALPDRDRATVTPAAFARSYADGGLLPWSDWAQRALALVYPIARRIRPGVWAYEPWPVDLAADIVAGLDTAGAAWHDFGPAGRAKIALPGILFNMKARPAGIGYGSAVPVSIRHAKNFADTLAESIAAWSRDPAFAVHMADARQRVEDMQAEVATAAPSVKAMARLRAHLRGERTRTQAMVSIKEASKRARREAQQRVSRRIDPARIQLLASLSLPRAAAGVELVRSAAPLLESAPREDNMQNQIMAACAAAGPKLLATVSAAKAGDPAACCALARVAGAAKAGDPAAKVVAARAAALLRASRAARDAATTGGFAWNVPYRATDEKGVALSGRLRQWYLSGMVAPVTPTPLLAA